MAANSAGAFGQLKVWNYSPAGWRGYRDGQRAAAVTLRERQGVPLPFASLLKHACQVGPAAWREHEPERWQQYVLAFVAVYDAICADVLGTPEVSREGH